MFRSSSCSVVIKKRDTEAVLCADQQGAPKSTLPLHLRSLMNCIFGPQMVKKRSQVEAVKPSAKRPRTDENVLKTNNSQRSIFSFLDH